MLKKYAYKKIALSTIALLILAILYLFPKSAKPLKIKNEINYIKTNKAAIYLIDKNDYVARTDIISNEKDTIEKAKYLLRCLIKESNEEIYIPYEFKAIIPKNTTINSITLDNGLLKIDFSKEFLNVSKDDEERMIESIIFTLTSQENIKEIMIFVNGSILNELPNSKKKLPSILDKSFGVNKIVDINNFKNTTQVISYYLNSTSEGYYYIPVTTVSNNEDEKVKIIIDQLKSRPLEKTNLIGFLNANAELKDYEILENNINLSFNNYLFDDIKNNTILEEIKYAIGYSINDTYGINKVSYLVDNKKIEEFIIN